MIIRKLTQCERGTVKAFYLALSPDDRRKRFWGVAPDETISRHLDGLDFSQHMILGAFKNTQLIGVAELAPGAEESELAFAVRPDMRCRRIGTRLMERILVHAGMSGKGKVFVKFPSDNAPMRWMAQKAGMSVKTDGGESYASKELPVPSAEERSRWLRQAVFAHSDYFSVLGIERWESLATQSKLLALQGRKTLDALAA
jgi:GNAT superfamily N-acetyltransferase